MTFGRRRTWLSVVTQWATVALAVAAPMPASAAASAAFGNSCPMFHAARAFNAGGDAYSVAIGDLNGDGKSDIVVANYDQNTVSVLLGQGDGTFAPAAAFSAGANPRSISIGDLNGDGKPDLAVVNSASNTVSVLLGSGDGTFAAPTAFGTGSTPFTVAICDLNRDGKPDLLVANEGTSTVSVLLGNGDGSFRTKVDYFTGPYPTLIAVGDVNGDGIPDLVTNGVADDVWVRLGNGDGTFGPKIECWTGEYASRSGAIADLNGDGKPDLVVANQNSSTISALLNTGAGIPTPTTIALVDAHATASRVELRWFGTSMAGATVIIYRQAAQGSWTPVASITGDGTGTIRFADVDVQPGARYGYRLGLREGGAEKFYGEVWVSVPTLALTLEGLRPNPAVGEPVASFTLPNGSPARLELLDVAGRVWLAREVGDLGAGSHLAHMGGSVPAGIYWLRLTQGGRSLLARAAVIR